MATRADVELVVRALSTLSAAAQRDFLRVWSGLDHDDWAGLRRTLEDFWPELIGHYGEMSAALASDQFVLQAAELGLRADPQMVRGVDALRANARLRWAIGAPDQSGSMLLILDELVKQPYRSTLQRSAAAAGGAWARVPSGSETCAWCLMLASRGFVYESAATAGQGRKFHGDCNCVPVLGRGPEDYPQGYDVEALYDQYEAARNAAGSGSTKKILSELRKQQGTH